MTPNIVLGGLGRNRVPPVVGGGSVTYDVSVDVLQEDLGDVTTGAVTIAATANRYAFLAVMTNDEATTIDAGKVGGSSGTSMSAILAEYRADWHDCRHFELVACPTGSNTFYGDLSAATSREWAAGIVYNGVHQTTPKNSTATPVTGDTTSASITVTTVTGGKALVVLVFTGDVPTLTPGTGVTVRTQENFSFGTLAILERDHVSGGSTAVAVTITSDTIIGWRLDGYGIQPA